MYVIITTNVGTTDLRKQQYERGITSIKREMKGVKLIIIENDGNRYMERYRDETCEIYYTKNNEMKTNKGNKEIKDIQDCIKEYKINDEEFIIKITGRYIIEKGSKFLQEINKGYECVIMYGSYMQPNRNNEEDCVTGLIGMKAKYIKEIKYTENEGCIEWSWAKTSQKIKNKCVLDELGINMCPGSNVYFYI